MAESRATQAAEYAELIGESAAATQAAILAELIGESVAATQAGLYAELTIAQSRATFAGIYAEFEYVAPPVDPTPGSTVNWGRGGLPNQGTGYRTPAAGGEGSGNRSARSVAALPFSPQPSKRRPNQVNFGSNRVHTALPEEVTGYALDDPDSFWRVIVPEATENLIKNPSFENADDPLTDYVTGNWASTAAESSLNVREGRYALRMVSNTGDEGYVGYVGLDALTSDAVYTWSFDWYGYAGDTYTIYILDGTSLTDILRRSFRATHSGWQRYEFTFKASGTFVLTGVSLSIKIASTIPDGRVYYTDRWQLEKKTYSTTYTDGSLKGYLEDPNPYAYAWTGVPHASSSIRSATTTSGGKIVALSTYGFKTTNIQGLGLPDQDVVVYGIRTPNDLIKSITPRNREFVLTGKVFGRNNQEVSKKRQGIIDLLRPRQMEAAQPIKLIYQPVDSRGIRYGQPLCIDCVCNGGLSGNLTNLYQETLAIKFTSYSPRFYEDGLAGVGSVSSPMLGSTTGYAERSRTHNWSDQGAGATNNLTQALAFDASGDPWIGGAFTVFNGLSIEYLAKWNRSTSLWEQVADGVGDVVGGLALSKHPVSPKMGIVGTFVVSGLNDVHNAGYYDIATDEIVEMATGLSDSANCIAAYHNGDFFIGGSFVNDFPLSASLLYIARYINATDAWDTVASGLNDDVRCITVGKDGMVYIGGNFTTSGAGAIALGHVAKYNPTTDAWVQMDDGFNGDVYALEFGPDGFLYAGGDFTQDAAGSKDLRGIARWNGRIWEEVGGGLDGTVKGLRTVGKYMYVSGDFTSGTMGLPSWALDYIARWDGNQWLSSDYATNHNTSSATLDLANDGRIALAAGAAYTNNWAALSTTVTNEGTAETNPIFLLAEGALYYEITNVTTNQSIFFKGLETYAGEECVLDFTGLRPKFYSNYRADLTPFVHLSASNYTDFRLVQGENIIKVMAKDADAFTAVSTTILWRNNHWSYDVAGDL